MNVELICDNCGKKFLRRKGEHNRNQKLDRRTFCTPKCCGKGIFSNIPIEKRYHPENLLQYNADRIDVLSPFKLHLRLCRRRSKKSKKPINITLEYLKEQWEKQKGICPYTGWNLKTPISSSIKYKLPFTPDRASLDRIDNSKGYIKGNVQFISLMAQLAKNSWSEEELIKFCEAVFQKGITH